MVDQPARPRVRRHGTEDDLYTASLKGPWGADIQYSVSRTQSTAEVLVTQLVLLYRNVAKGKPEVMDAVDLTAEAALGAIGGWSKAILIARARERYRVEDPARYWQSKPTPQEADRHARQHTFYAPEPDDPRDDVPPFALWAHRHADWKTAMTAPRVLMLRGVNGQLEAMDRTEDSIDMRRWEGEWCRLTPDMIPVPKPSPTETPLRG
jgi:hypothetical protein